MQRWPKVTLLTLCFLLASSALAWASTGSQTIEVVYRNIKLVVHGKEVPTADEPFIYNGRTYMPLRAVGEALNEPVKWDGATSTILIGAPPSEQAKFLTDIQPFYTGATNQWGLVWRQDNESGKELPDQPMTMGRVAYRKGYMVYLRDLYSRTATFSWNLNAQYTSVTGLVGLDDARNQAEATITFLGDDVRLAEVKVLPGELPKPVQLSLKGVLVLKVTVSTSPASYVDLVNLALQS